MNSIENMMKEQETKNSSSRYETNQTKYLEMIISSKIKLNVEVKLHVKTQLERQFLNWEVELKK